MYVGARYIGFFLLCTLHSAGMVTSLLIGQGDHASGYMDKQRAVPNKDSWSPFLYWPKARAFTRLHQYHSLLITPRTVWNRNYYSWVPPLRVYLCLHCKIYLHKVTSQSGYSSFTVHWTGEYILLKEFTHCSHHQSSPSQFHQAPLTSRDPAQTLVG